MTLEDLQAMGLDEAAAGQVLAMHSREMEQLSETGAQALEEQKAQANRLKAQWESDLDGMRLRLEAGERAAATGRAAGALRFTSDSARRCFMQELERAALPLEDGRLAGFERFVADYREKDPAALWPEGAGPLFALAGGGVQLDGDDAVRRAFGL